MPGPFCIQKVNYAIGESVLGNRYGMTTIAWSGASSRRAAPA
jgi:hypothetical protein